MQPENLTNNEDGGKHLNLIHVDRNEFYPNCYNNTDETPNENVGECYHDISVSQEYCFSAEIGLSGEIRPVSKIDQRIKECSKLGYKNFVTSKSSKIQKSNNKTEIISVSKIEDLINYLFG